MRIKLSKDKMFKDKSGKVVIGQRPNWPLYIWLFGIIGNKVFVNGFVHTTFRTISFAAIVFWSFQEIFQGVNYFRRILGLIILSLTLFSKFIY